MFMVFVLQFSVCIVQSVFLLNSTTVCVDKLIVLIQRQVKYFAKRRDFLKYKEKIQTEGYEPREGASKLS